MDTEKRSLQIREPPEEFLWAAQKAIDRFAGWRFARIARSISQTLERDKPSGIFDFPSHANQWREFCYHAHFGPPELEAAFDHLINPLIHARLEELPIEEAVLLSVAQQWEAAALDHQDGTTVSPDLLKQGARVALQKLALATDCDSWDG